MEENVIKLVLRGFRDDGTPLGAPGITLDPGKQFTPSAVGARRRRL